MHKITTEQKVKNVAEAWKASYYRAHHWISIFSGSSEVIYKRLKELSETATAKDVEDIIGNSSWTSLTCHECDNSVDIVIQVGENPDWGSSTAQICPNCLRKALALSES